MAGAPARIGELRHRLTLEAARGVADGGGGRADPWANPLTVASLWGKVEPLTGNERLHAMQIQDRVSHRIVIRHRAGVTPAMRIVFGDRVFNIRAVINVEERGRFLELLCEEGVAT